MIWIFYLAIEPYVRRFWPETLVAWSRVLEGRFRDPMVGRHILIGALAGMGVTLLCAAAATSPGRSGWRRLRPSSVTSMPSRRFRFGLAQVFAMVQQSFFIPVACLLAVLVFRVIFRRPWLAYGSPRRCSERRRLALAQGANQGLSAAVLSSWQAMLSCSSCWSSSSSRVSDCSRCW